MKNHVRNALLASASAIALLISSERGVEAQEAPATIPRWILSAETQYIMFGGDTVSSAGLDADPGWAGAVSLFTQAPGSPVSFKARLRYGKSGEASSSTATSTYSSFASSSSSSSSRTSERFLIADAEFGRDVGIGALPQGSSLRVHGGLRFAYMKAKADNSSASAYSYSGFYSSSNSSSTKTENSFAGIGPRIGADLTVPVMNRLTANVGAAGSLLFGKRKSSSSTATAFASYSSFGGGSGSSSATSNRSSNAIVPNAELSASLTYLLGDRASLTGGYQVDHYWGVFDDQATGKANRTIHGPFVRFNIQLGGP